MWAARCPLEERVYRGAGRSRRRVRGDGVLVWSGVALPCLCGGSFLGLFFLSRESDAVVLRIYVLALRLCKKRSLCIRANKHGGYYYYDYVIAPGSGSGLAAATARPSK